LRVASRTLRPSSRRERQAAAASWARSRSSASRLRRLSSRQAQSPTTGASWSSGSATNTGQADALFVGGAGYETLRTPRTSTVTSGTEIYSLYDGTDQQGFSSGYKISTTVAASSITGTLSNSASTANTGLLVIYAGLAVPADNTTKPARAGMFTPQLRQDGWF
jgi:hypothetical protein